jgi:hypothetical protein
MQHSSDIIEMGGRKHGFNGRVGRNAEETAISGEMGMTLAAVASRNGASALSADAIYPYPAHT